MAVSINRLLPIRAIGPGLCLIDSDRFSSIVEAVPVNFSLRSQSDQQRLIQGYTEFLNGLEFPVELLVRSDMLRLDEYLGDLKAHEAEIEPHLRPSLGDYIEFIQDSVSVHHLLRRRFFVVLSWNGGLDSKRRPKQRGEVLWDEAEAALERRRDIVEQGLRPLGIRLRSFTTEETFRFFYASLGGGQSLPAGVNWAWD